ncbi:MAG: hypothetical protein JST84_27490 [Acidobacteria bacterium]|nr:hypothetical protein [Acidobacteriota bacterium]
MKSSADSLRMQAARVKPKVKARAGTLGTRQYKPPAHESGRQMKQLLAAHDYRPTIGGYR